ncbi:hypothetical protein [Niallia sp. 01092]|uniref:hypothetical protein n=1 Tax=unclassified Niallia TaxID=2837522 RepID=UPI003FD55A03
MEFGTSIHVPFEDPVFDYYLLQEREHNKQQILLFAAPEHAVSSYTDLVEEAKASTGFCGYFCPCFISLICKNSYVVIQNNTATAVCVKGVKRNLCTKEEVETPIEYSDLKPSLIVKKAN